MNIEDLIAQLPESLKPIGREYGPALLEMTGEELWAWVRLLLNGQDVAAHRALVAKMSNADLAEDAFDFLDGVDEAVTENADRVATQRAALNATLKAVLKIAMVVVGVPFPF